MAAVVADARPSSRLRGGGGGQIFTPCDVDGGQRRSGHTEGLCCRQRDWQEAAVW